MMSKVVPVGVIVGTLGIIFGQEASFPMDLVIQGGAVGVLGYVTFHLLVWTIPAMQKAFQETLDRMSDRHERWETARHADSKELSDTLTKLSTTCTRVHGLLKEPE